MGKSSRRKSRDKTSAPDGTTTEGRAKGVVPHLSAALVRSLAVLPRALLLQLRRDLALEPLSEALHPLHSSHPEVASALEEVGGDVGAQALAAALAGEEGGDGHGPRLHCWSFTADAEAVDAGCKALRTLFDDGRVAFLEALKRGEPFCGTATKRMGRKDSAPILKLGKHRAMWLLGASPAEPMLSDPALLPKKRKRKGSNEKHAESASSEGSAGTNNCPEVANNCAEGESELERGQQDEQVVVVTATTMSGQRACAEVSATATVLHARHGLASIFGVQPDQLMLCLHEEVLQDDCNLIDLGLDSVILDAVLVMPPEVSKRILDLLDDKFCVRLEAARALGVLGEASAPAVPALEQALQDPHQEVRIEVARALGKIGPKASSAATALESALQLFQFKDGFSDGIAALSCAPQAPGAPGPTALTVPGGEEGGEFAASLARSCVASVLTALGKIGEAGVPALAKAMEVKEMRAIAVAALGEAGEAAAPAIPQLVRALEDGDSVCYAAAAVLGSLGPLALGNLVHAIENNNPRVRACVVSALGQIRDDRSVWLLQDALKDADWGVCMDAMVALGRMGELGMQALKQALVIDYWVVQDKLVEILESSGEIAVPMLDHMLRDADLPISLRMRVVVALGKIGTSASEAVFALASQHRHLPACLRAQVVVALGRLGDAAVAAVPMLEDLLNCSEQAMDVRVAATEALSCIGGPAVATLATQLLRRDVDAVCSRIAAEALGTMGAPAVSVLAAALAEPDAYLREDCACALGAIGVSALPAVPALVHLLDDTCPWVRWRAVEALGAIPGAHQAIPAMVQTLGDSCESVRVATIIALGKQGAAAAMAVAALEICLPDPEFHSYACKALGAIAWSAKKCAAVYTQRHVAAIAMRLDVKHASCK